MGFLDDIAKQVTGGGSDSGASDMSSHLLSMLGSQQGGIGGLVQQFENKGLGNVAQSWVSTGQNQPISADQVQQVLGSPWVQQFAQKAGIDPNTAAPIVARLLPVVVDKLTPNGQVPQNNDWLSAGLDMLKGQMNK